MSPPRMRTAPEAIAELKRNDPDTALTLTAIRRMMNNGTLPYITVNSKRLINLDTLYGILNGTIEATPERAEDYGKVRSIAV